jgi:hypothetical protein
VEPKRRRLSARRDRGRSDTLLPDTFRAGPEGGHDAEQVSLARSQVNIRMASERTITSAALYFGHKQSGPVSLRWFERAQEFFADYNLSPVLFTAFGGPFLLDDCYVLTDHGADLVIFGETLAARGNELVEAIRSRKIESLYLNSPEANATNREHWRAAISTSSAGGSYYLGIDENLVGDASTLLRRAYRIAKDRLDVRYAIAYRLPQAESPDCYASGHVKTSMSDVLNMIRHRREWDSRKKTPDELWSDELAGKRRHLSGLFRGAYPANIVSEAHIRSADLKSHGIGKFTELDGSLWLWELSAAEVPAAEELLNSQGVLVSQTAQGA